MENKFLHETELNISKTTLTMYKMENDLLDEMSQTQKPKFKFNATGIFFVAGSVCIIWKTIDVLIFVIHLF